MKMISLFYKAFYISTYIEPLVLYSSHYMPRFLLSALVFFPFVCFLPGMAMAGNESITLQLKWNHQFQFAGYYAAIEQGYYREAGLDVHLREAVFGKDPVQAVIHGEAEYGVGTSSLLLNRAGGAPVVVLGVVFQHSPFVLITHEAVNDLHALLGKRIMLDINGSEVIAMLQRSGLSPDSYAHIEQTFDTVSWLQGDVDAMSAYITDEPYELSQRGIAYHIFNPVSFGVDFYGDNLFTTEQEILKHPQRVQAFRNASFKGWTYAMQHPDEMIQLITTKYHSQQPVAKLHYEANTMQSLLEHGFIPAGYMYAERWQSIVSTYQTLGLLPANFNLQGFIYHPEVNFFDRAWRWRREILAGMLILLLMIAATVMISLRKMVKQRTSELHDSKMHADRANAEKSRFLAAVSHDMRQPMQAMRFYMDVLGAQLKQDKNQSIIRKLEGAHDDFSALFTRCLDISQLDAGAMQPQREVFDVGIVLQQLHAQYLPLADAAGLSFRLHQPGITILIYSDRAFVVRILTNLIGNALRYTQQGSIMLAARRRGSSIQLSVWDTGPGIKDIDQAEIFQEFLQLNNAERDRNKGVGLGLSIASRMCCLLGEPIELKSVCGKGSQFFFDVPQADSGMQIEAKAYHTEMQTDFSGMRVFVIDDDARLRDSLRMMLVQWCCDVECFADGKQAVAALEQAIPDAIISDYRLANEITGFDVILQLQTVANKTIPALLLSGDSDPMLMQQAISAGLPLLIKPVSPSRLRRFLESLQQVQ